MIGEFNSDCSSSGGITSHIYSLSQELINQGHEVFIITHPQHQKKKNKKGGGKIKMIFMLYLALVGILKVLEC